MKINLEIVNIAIFGAMIVAATIYNYTVPIGDGNDTIVMHYDEPTISEKKWQEMEEADEKEHAEESKEWYSDGDKDDGDDNDDGGKKKEDG